MTDQKKKHFRLEIDPDDHHAVKVFAVTNNTTMTETICLLISEFAKANKGKYSSVDIDAFIELLQQPTQAEQS